MPQNDPYVPGDQHLYECLSCEKRVWAAHQPTVCEDCGGPLQNISIARGE